MDGEDRALKVRKGMGNSEKANFFVHYSEKIFMELSKVY
jgi:hypothetical protein